MKRADSDDMVVHLAIAHIMKSKSYPDTNVMKKLVDALSSHLFNLYYLKCKDVILSGFFSRMEGDKGVPQEFIVISFNSHSILTELYYTFLELPKEMYRIITSSQIRMIETQMSKVHTADRELKPKP